MTVLLLGGTAEARALAGALRDAGIAATSSLAGRVSDPRLPVGDVRVGGFGGAGGLAAYLRETDVDAVVDATHPFAVGISANAVAASARTGIPLLRFVRPGWSDHPDAETWTWVADHAAAARTAAGLGSRVLITTGRQALGIFVPVLREAPVLARVVDLPDLVPPPSWEIRRDRGPYDLDGEVRLMREHGTEVLVTKDSGGSYTAAKLDAAREVGAAVVVVRRPAWTGTGPTVTSVGDAVAWARSTLGP
ncbi:precorrin-6A/cobalt-precorrin-6A reductase [Mumia flava]|uniref:Precorrin-6A/cobalt-precorrin-6A reductase n=1 Tax=Mumia flava TaxID=1348852 RepID=A0A0B2BQF2_9ACTN|nr:cobalt-precorrin-6A reductase [Mumia flava]PJJ58017.1 precorrin-6A/cobalt-precorrin-6A reductase [Mumia flava]